MSPSAEAGAGDRPGIPDVDRLAQSMLLLHGGHDDDHGQRATRSESRYKAPAFSPEPDGVAALREATQADREHYLTAGLTPVNCGFCHVTVNVKKLGPGHIAVQWNTEAWQRCAYFDEVRAAGGNTARVRACPKLADSL